MRTRAALAVSFCLLLPIVSLAAEERRAGSDERISRRVWWHFVLDPQHILSEAERSDLAENGCVIERALPGGRYLVSISSQSGIDNSDLRVKKLTPLMAEAKMDVSAYRAAAQAKPFARVKILFHDDASLTEAQRAIEEAGGTVEDPLAYDFGPLRSLRARVPSMSILQLADDEAVLSIYAARTFRATAWNADEAAMSSVTPLYAAPYNLSGSGVVLSYFELAPAQADHPEFEGRLSIDFTCASSDTQCADSGNKLHATHVGGTMIAAGLTPAAKGMAPKATLHEFEGADPNDAWLGQKDTALKQLGAVADNNSWGYVLGWSQSSTSGGWVWNGADELIGGYDGTLSAVLDHIAITGVTLMDHASGNEGGIAGPTSAPFKHAHTDDQGNETKDVYCYSANGSGTDCSATDGCTAGAAFCETTPHPVHTPYGSIGWTASAKNVVAVGAIDSSKVIAGFTSRGPTKDGRIKPDIVAKGRSVYSTAPPSVYATESGTSMATPVVTGSMALFAEQWRKTFGSSPPPVALKALAIAGADDLGNSGPDFDYGFGLLDSKKSVDLIIADGGTGKRIRIDKAANGSQFDYPVAVSQAQDLRVVLSWFDPEALPLNAQQVTLKVLINDLDVKVVDPNGNTVLPYVLDMNHPTTPATRGVNTVDNTEEVEIKGATPGVYHVIVTGTTVTANPPQQFVLIANADVGTALPPCVDPTEPNSTAATAYGPLATNSVTQARICDATDVDFFRFVPNVSGVATIVVSASDTPLTVSVGSGTDALSPLVTQNVASGASQTFTINASAGTQYLVSVKPNGTLGASGAYTVSATYPFTWPARRRSARR
jgi:Subtilase family